MKYISLKIIAKKWELIEENGTKQNGVNMKT